MRSKFPDPGPGAKGLGPGGPGRPGPGARARNPGALARAKSLTFALALLQAGMGAVCAAEALVVAQIAADDTLLASIEAQMAAEEAADEAARVLDEAWEEVEFVREAETEIADVLETFVLAQENLRMLQSISQPLHAPVTCLPQH